MSEAIYSALRGPVGDPHTCHGAFERCARYRREQGDTWSLATHLNNIGDVASSTRDMERARDCFLETPRMRREQADRDGLAWTLRSLGYPGSAIDPYEYAARVVAVAAAIRAQLGSGFAQHAQALRDRHVEPIRGRLGADAYAAMWAEGQALPYEDALDFALGLQCPYVSLRRIALLSRA